MPYNNYYPATYQQMYPTYPTTPVPNVQQASTSNGIVWVQGEAGAKAYPVVAGTSVLLMDSENEQFFIKSTDPSGMPMPLRVFSYTETTQNRTKTGQINELDMSKYITREELETRLKTLLTAKNEEVK